MSQEPKLRNQNLTVPNALSALRILLVPFFAWAFLTGHTIIATVLLLASGLSDALDGFIARKFNQITEVGKMLDPLADKLTQGMVAICLAVKFSVIRPVLILFIVKELGMVCCASVLLKRKKGPGASRWYGKVATAMFYVSVGVIVMMDGVFKLSGPVFSGVALGLLLLTAVMMIYAAVKYFQIFLMILHSDDEKYDLDLNSEIHAKTARKPRENVRRR